MKAKVIFIILLCISWHQADSQKLSRWYNMSPSLDVEGGTCLYSSVALDSTLTVKYQLQLDYIENINVSSFAFLAINDFHSEYIKDEVIGVIGTIDSQEVLIIDSDLDRSLNDEVVIPLPKLKKDTSINYSEKYVYRTDFNQNFQITYEKIINEQIHQKNTNLGFAVKHRYNSDSDQLEYLDKFDICFNQKLVYYGLLDDIQVEIKCYDYLPWITIVRFNLRTKDFPNKEIANRTPFRVKEEGKLFTIDSVDFINNKFLIFEYGTSEKFYFSGESLFSDREVETDSTTNNTKLIHVWGSWCGPCIKNFPKLKELQNELKNVEFIGICEEGNKQDGVDGARKAGITWKNIYMNYGDNELNILSYPTYIVLKNNEVLGRFSKIELAEEFLKSKIN